METKEQKIERLKERITGFEFILETLEEQKQKGKWYKEVKSELNKTKQELKELEDDGRNNKN